MNAATVYKNATIRPYLVSDVDYYKIPADFANTFQKAGYAEQQADPIAFLKKATQQHDTLCRIFTEVAGVAPIRLSAKNGLYDAVFTSDPFITIAVPEKNGELKRLIIPSKFSNTGREPEVAHSMRYLKTLWPDAKIITPTHNIEGSGDNTYDCFRGVYWSGFKSEEDEEPKENEKNISAGRSDKEAHAVLQSATGIPVHSIELIGDFFHIDTILCPLPNGHIMVYPGGMTPESFAYFKKTAFEDYGLDPDEYMIEVSEEDAYAYACNARGIDNNVIIPQCSDDHVERLAESGYKTHQVDVSCFLASGGGVKCLSHNIGLVHQEGGTSGIVQAMPEHAPITP